MLRLDWISYPVPQLQPFIESYHGYTVTESLQKDFMVPEGIAELVFQIDTNILQTDPSGSWAKRIPVFLGGLHSVAYQMQNIGSGYTFSVRFKPGGFSHFSSIPVHHFKNRMIDPCEIWPDAGEKLAQQITEAESNNHRSIISNDFFQNHFLTQKSAAVLEAATEIMKCTDNIKVDQLADKYNLSTSRFRVLFNEVIGCSPKEFAMIKRINQAFKERNDIGTLARLAAKLGYFDQAHFVHDCKRITGYSPAKLLAKRLITDL